MSDRQDQQRQIVDFLSGKGSPFVTLALVLLGVVLVGTIVADFL